MKSRNERNVHGCQIETAGEGSPPVRFARLRSLRRLSPGFSEIVPVQEKHATIVGCLGAIEAHGVDQRLSQVK